MVAKLIQEAAIKIGTTDSRVFFYRFTIRPSLKLSGRRYFSCSSFMGKSSFLVLYIHVLSLMLGFKIQKVESKLFVITSANRDIVVINVGKACVIKLLSRSFRLIQACFNR